MWFKRNVESNKSAVIELGSRIFGSQGAKKSMLSKDWWYSKVMDWSMKSNDFKVRMFRFVDVFPYLRNGQEILNHLKEYFEDENGKLPAIFSLGASIGQLAPEFMAKSVEKNITEMAKLFITGESPEKAVPKIEESRKRNWAFTADLLGEKTLSESEAASYMDRYLSLIEILSNASKNWEDQPLIDTNHAGVCPKVNISVKISSLYSQIKVEDWERSKKILVERLKTIFQKAMKSGVFVNIDMEHYEYKDLTLDVFEEITMLPEFKEYSHWGIVIQAYLKDSLEDCKRLVEFAKKRKTPFTVRIVKGAYWDYELVHANQNSWPVPVFTKKQNSDHYYEKCAQLLLSNHNAIWTALGSHNVRSLAASLVFAENKKIPKNAFEVQMLFGMGDQFKASLVDMGYRVREYATIGELVPGMAYLVRRLLENSSNQSFLQNKNSKALSDTDLLKEPVYIDETPPLLRKNKFINHPLLDFSKSSSRINFKKSVEHWTHFFTTPQPVPYIINGKELHSEIKLKRLNPNDKTQVLYEFSQPTPEHLAEAIHSAEKAIKTWSSREMIPERIKFIENVADEMEKNREHLASLQTIEVGKPWKEADGDITEAIDFCRFYAREAKKLFEPINVSNAPGEESYYSYRPKGLASVIAPWNFPLAILSGMTVAPLLCGNPVLIKPAEQSTYTAYEFFKILLKAGIPKEVVQFLPGKGEEVGHQLVTDPRVSIINFTGSKEVGLQIIREAATLKKNQNHVKKPIIEMGGKNALIIDSDADLDQAVPGLLYSAFGFSGQKCSACSRAFVLEGIYDQTVSRLEQAMKSVSTKESIFPGAYLGPVVDETSFNRIMDIVKTNVGLFPYATGETSNSSEGYFVPPHIFFDVDPKSKLAQDEIFGPVLAIIKVKNLDEAIELVNDSSFALTGGIFSRTPSHIERVTRELEVGNLYINRSITGAMVQRHPFGGFKLSGLGSKTGGPDYLKAFVEPQVRTENLMRQGFSPDVLESFE